MPWEFSFVRYNENMKRILPSILLFAALGLCSCVQPASVELEKEQTNLGFLESAEGELMLTLNSEVTMTTVCPDLRELLSSEAQEQVQHIHQLIDSHHRYTSEAGADIVNVYYLNRHIGEGPIAIDQDLFDCLEEALVMAELTEGYFNPTVGKLANLYEGKFTSFETIQENPSAELIQQALETVVPYTQLRQYVLLDASNSTVELVSYQGKDFALSLGAIGKGFALTRVGLSQDSSFLLSAGASSIRGYVAAQEDEISWNVAVHEPDSTDLLFAFELNSASVSTSGDDENYYLLADGTRVHHVLNPFTGTSENFYRNVVLVGQDAGVLDALSTALFNMSDEQEIHETIERVEEHYGMHIDYGFVTEEDGGTYLLRGNEGLRKRIIPEYMSDKLNPRMYIMEEDAEAA